MKRLTWAKISAGLALVYGVFLIIQVFIEVWLSEMAHKIAMFAGGIFLILWTACFWKLK
jgi:uncharacterized membrane protein